MTDRRYIEIPEAAPQDVEAEQFTLGAVFMATGSILDRLSTEMRLGARHFYREAHGIVYAAMQAVAGRGERVDLATTRYELEARDQLVAAGGVAGLELLSGSVPALGNWPVYARRVIEMAEWREELNQVYGRLEAIARRDRQALEETKTVDTLGMAGYEGLLTPEDLAREWMDHYDRPRDEDGTIKTPWPKINAGLFGGLRPGDMTVIAGWPGKGKSTAGDQILDHAIDSGHARSGCAYVNEMSTIDRTSRLLAGKSGVSFKKLMERDLSPDEIKKTLAAAPRLPFAIQPCAGWSAEAIARHMRRHKWDIALVDHATRIPARDVGDWDNVSRALSDAARQTGTHLLVAVQLNRERATSMERPMPVLRDLRSTSAWEHDARAVMFVHRREELDKDTDLVVEYDDGVIHLAKVNNGRKDAERVYLNYSKMRFQVLVEGPATVRGNDW